MREALAFIEVRFSSGTFASAAIHSNKARRLVYAFGSTRCDMHFPGDYAAGAIVQPKFRQLETRIRPYRWSDSQLVFSFNTLNASDAARRALMVHPDNGVLSRLQRFEKIYVPTS